MADVRITKMRIHASRPVYSPELTPHSLSRLYFDIFFTTSEQLESGTAEYQIYASPLLYCILLTLYLGPFASLLGIVQRPVPEFVLAGAGQQHLRKMIDNEQTDILPAISALARSIPAEAGGRYLAGLWSNDLLRGLLWRPVGPDEMTFDELVRARDGSDGYVAPSWSWACERRAVKWNHGRSVARLHCHVIEAETILQGSDVFGQVKGGFLCLWAKVRELGAVQVVPHPHMFQVKGEWRVKLGVSTTRATLYLDWCSEHLDVSSCGTKEFPHGPLEKLTMALVMGWSAFSNDVLAGVLLFPCGECSVYIKVGTFDLGMRKGEAQEFWTQMEGRSIKIS